MTAGKFRQNVLAGGNFKRRKGAGPSRDGFFRKKCGTGMAGPSRPPKKSLSPAAAFSGLIGAGKTVSNCTGML
nr:hypothetical protein [Bacillaceae bacterium]